MTTLKMPVSSRDHILGDEDAPITLLEYGDYECPHCGAAHPVVKALLQRYPDDVRYIFRHFPLTQIHPHAEAAAETAEFADSYDRFWEMHNLIFENQDRLSIPFLFSAAESLGLSVERLQQALRSGEFSRRVRQDFLSGVRSGVNGTPSFFINGERHNGSYAFTDLSEAIENQLELASRRAA
ncbi:MAG: putative Membrane protein [Acidobacteriales bacterium]|nr:putative Membrane protein [Terriglobales bacterium]